MHTKTILLADDEAHITCVVSAKLRDAGFNVVTARDGEEAYELALRVSPSLVVTDLQMPRMSGFELSCKLKSTPSTSRVPVLMLTARGYIVDASEMGKTNIKAMMCKPFSARDVVRRVNELLEQSEAAAAPQEPRQEAA